MSGYRTMRFSGFRGALVGLVLIACDGGAKKQGTGAGSGSATASAGAGAGLAQVQDQSGSGAATSGGSAAAASGSAGGADDAAMPPVWASVLGDKPATFGPTLAGFGFGKPIDEAALPDVPATTWGTMGEVGGRNLRLAPETGGPKIRVDLDIEGGTLFAVNVELYSKRGIPQDDCVAFLEALARKWGPASDRVWFDRANGVRMVFSDTCRLRFERYVDVSAWIGPDASSIVPVAAVGSPTRSLAARAPTERFDADLTFRAPGIGEKGDGYTTIDVYTEDGAIRGLGADARTTDIAAVRDRISSAFNAKPTRDAKTDSEVWPTTPPIRLHASRSGVRVEVGNLTP